MNNPSTIYIYKRQRFNTLGEISESKVHNPYSVPRKTIEKKVRDLRKNKTIEQRSDKEENLIILTLTDDIFEPIKSRNISVVTPSGETITGSKKELHESLYYQHPDLVPDKYTTLISRLGKPNWSNEQAFGFEYPPDLLPVKPLIETQGYTWADGQKPNFLTHHGKPVTLHETKEIFPNQAQFAAAYGLPTDMVSDYLNVKKMTPEAFLKHKGLTLSF